MELSEYAAWADFGEGVAGLFITAIVVSAEAKAVWNHI
jgi:hypothetical protein